MPDPTQASETPAPAPEATPAPQVGADGTPFDPARAQRTIEQQREELRTLKAAAKELADAKARLKEIEDKDKSEVERLAGSAKEAGEKLAAAEAALRESRIQIAAERLARKLNFHDEEDAFLHLQRSPVEYDDAGQPTNAEALLIALAKAKPHLVKAADAGTPSPSARSTPATPKPAAPAGRADLIEQTKKELQASGQYGRL